MSKEQAETEIRAAAWTAAARVGWREAIDILKQVAGEIERAQWSGPGNR